jgi:SAM-dependent methyltransferase
MDSTYLRTVAEVYAEAATEPDASLCCTASRAWRFPDLVIPPIMMQMNYGCGTTVDPRDLHGADTIVYIGVGGGLEALQFAYFTRQTGAVIAVDPVAEMRARARKNFDEAARLNPWFRPEFIEIVDGSALDMPVADGTAAVLAQNCLFNVFIADDLERALREVVRVLRTGGLFSTSDPITPMPLPSSLTSNARLRARCISGCQTYDAYVSALVQAGFGMIEVRDRFPYRWLHSHDFPELRQPLLLETLEVAARKLPEGPDGPAVFTGKTATYVGNEESLADRDGFKLERGIPLPVSDAAALRLAMNADILITPSTYRARGPGCC